MHRAVQCVPQVTTMAVVERLRQAAPALAQRFEVWDPCLVLKGV